MMSNRFKISYIFNNIKLFQPGWKLYISVIISNRKVEDDRSPLYNPADRQIETT